MSSESNHDPKFDAILFSADFSNDTLFFKKILNKFEENISEESNPDDFISNVICHHNLFVSGGKLG